MIKALILMAVVGLPFFTKDGAPIASRDEKVFPHAVLDTVRFMPDSTTVTLRKYSIDGRTAIAFSDTNSYQVICVKADSIRKLSGSQFRIYSPAALDSTYQVFQAIGN